MCHYKDTRRTNALRWEDVRENAISHVQLWMFPGLLGIFSKIISCLCLVIVRDMFFCTFCLITFVHVRKVYLIHFNRLEFNSSCHNKASVHKLLFFQLSVTQEGHTVDCTHGYRVGCLCVLKGVLLVGHTQCQ